MRKKPSKIAAKKVMLPGDLKPADFIDSLLRVDHAGEFGAQRIYAGQLAVLKESAAAPAIRKMAQQEDEHLATFEKLMIEKRARPTALYPLWHTAGFALGAATAMLGEKAAMACTVAIEETIVEHYKRQLAQLTGAEPALRRIIKKFCDDEDAHRRSGLERGARDLPYYPLLRAAIRAGSQAAIWLSERI